MFKLCVFAGTTEGRRLIEFLSDKPARVLACVATEYGETLIRPAQNLAVSAKRLDEGEMQALFEGERFDLVIDATHPYASVVSENVVSACKKTETEYLRLERGEPGSAVPRCFSSTDEAARYLNGTEGNILFTTGSKELSRFSIIEGFAARAYARVLPMEDSLRLCADAGLHPSHIIAMQGPFSREMNAATINAVNAAFVVTKMSGRAGGFDEKAEAAKECGAELVVIGRPPEKAGGLSYRETLKYLQKRFGFAHRSFVTVCGIGMGGRETLTLGADEAIRSAECIIGAKRMTEAARADQAVFEAVSPVAIADYIREHGEFSRFCVLMSGDTGFFSGTKKLLPLLDFCAVKVLPGISSLSYLCAKAGLSYEDVLSVSLHGREANIGRICSVNRRVFALVSGENGAGRLIRFLADEAGLGYARITVGERLGYPDERITSGTANELKSAAFNSLSAVYIENTCPKSAAFGLPDAIFARNNEGEAVVPMTKSEVRSVCMSKLGLLSDSVVWDVGSGTGSVSVEAALISLYGKVYAIEKKHGAAELTRLNAKAAQVCNIEVVEGSAPEVCIPLPSPTHAFIGGSSGNMKEIISLLLEKNPSVRIVATAISLETVCELTECAKQFGFEETEIVCLNASRARSVGGYNLMTAQNPVYIFTMQGKGL